MMGSKDISLQTSICLPHTILLSPFHFHPLPYYAIYCLPFLQLWLSFHYFSISTIPNLPVTSHLLPLTLLLPPLLQKASGLLLTYFPSPFTIYSTIHSHPTTPHPLPRTLLLLPPLLSLSNPLHSLIPSLPTTYTLTPTLTTPPHSCHIILLAFHLLLPR